MTLVAGVGCGSSGSGSATSSRSTAATLTGTVPTATLTTTQTTPPTATGTPPTAGGTPPTAAGSPPTATGTPPTAPETAPPTAPSTTSTPPSDVRLPATFTVMPSGALGPRTVIAPPHIPVELTVVSGDGRAHRALLRTPVPHALTIPAHGRASVLITGLRNGQYSLEIDGVQRGTLVVGGAPGP